MENDSISSSSSESKLPLIVGIVGFALGAAGLVLALKAKSAADKASADAATTSASVSELSGQISAKANTSDVTALSGSLDQFKADTKTSFDTLQAEVAKIGSAKAKATTTGGKGAVAGNGEYIIAKGDNLGAIAKKLGTTVKSLQELNPGINPTNLKVGSKIKTK
jgi:LysM repeat protein